MQRGVGDKAVNQLEKSVYTKLEATVSRQIQAQFQTSGKQVIQASANSAWLIYLVRVSKSIVIKSFFGLFYSGLVKV